MSILLALDMSDQIVTEKKATIDCSDAELGLFSTRTVDGGNVAVGYNVYLFYTNKNMEQQ